MYMTRVICSAVLLIAMSSALVAQEVPAFPQPVKEHEWLQQFVGEWETEAEASMGPGQPPIKCKGEASSRMLGGFWLINETQGDMMGMTVNAVQTIGYDAEKKKYVGTWVDSMVNYMWNYEGEVDPSGKKLILEADGPNFMTGGKLTKFRDAYEFKSKDHIEATSSMLGEDGKWVQFMVGQMRRKK
jgi:hypothetical protein